MDSSDKEDPNLKLSKVTASLNSGLIQQKASSCLHDCGSGGRLPAISLALHACSARANARTRVTLDTREKIILKTLRPYTV